MSKPILKMTTLFTGIGCQERGVEQANIWDLNVIQTCEMDTNAIISYAAIHNGLTLDMIENYSDYPPRDVMAQELTDMRIGYDFVKNKEYDWFKKAKSKSNDLEKTWLACKLNHNVGDIMRVDCLEPTDLLTWSFPCSDLSVAGKQAGLVKSEDGENGTRSGLVYEVIRILWNMKEKNILPRFMIMENVDALVNKKNKPAYELINKELEEIGYNCYYDCINTKYCSYFDHPTPQNRNRCYAMYIRKDVDKCNYEFPKKFDCGIRLKDILLDEVDDKFYIRNPKADELIDKLVEDGKITEADLEDDYDDDWE